MRGLLVSVLFALSVCVVIYGVVQSVYTAFWAGVFGVWVSSTVWVFLRYRGVKIDADSFPSDGGGGWGDGGGGD